MPGFIPMQPPTPTQNSIPLRRADFASLADALDYAAQGETGANFYAGSGKLSAVLPYRTLREQALVLAKRLHSLSLERGARIAIVAETNPDFLRFFFACQYAGFVPVALPATVNLGGHGPYVSRLRGLLRGCGASVAVASDQFLRFLQEATKGVQLSFVGSPDEFNALPEQDVALQRSGPTEIAYLQYTSGSTGFPRGVVITQQTVLSNLAGSINHGLDMRADDRCVSWLPFYHDMGLVGCMLTLMAAQRSVDYLDTRDFAMRPRRWLELMSTTRATIAYSPPFGYELCARRVSPRDVERYDLSAWRTAGVGAEPIHAELLERFAELLAPTGFDAQAFVPSYGMAECSLAISYSPLREGVKVDWIDADTLAHHLLAKPVAANSAGANAFVRCGAPLPGHEVAIHDEQGVVLPALHVGRIHVRGPSVMSGYFHMPEETRKVLSPDGWLDTGDIGYLVDGDIVVTGRHKDMIIINGRNVWPQDIEQVARRQPELRSMDASAFSVTGPIGDEVAVLVVQCNTSNATQNLLLTQRLHREIHEELGISCLIELVPRHTLPRTSSGKLSRSAARLDYLHRKGQRSGDTGAHATISVNGSSSAMAQKTAPVDGNRGKNSGETSVK